jgi:hypothetical protein
MQVDIRFLAPGLFVFQPLSGGGAASRLAPGYGFVAPPGMRVKLS